MDALCINQDDAEEKNQQVKMMRDIYGKAEQVFAWLGRCDEASERGIHLTIQLAQLSYSGKIHIPFNEPPPDRFHNEVLASIGLPSNDSPVWTGLIRLINRPYFYRIWVLQEFVLAKEPIFLVCGGIIIRWTVLQFTALWPYRTRRLYKIERPMSLAGYSLLNRVLLLKRPKTRFNLMEVLEISRGLEATDPRDHIVAVLGLVSGEDKVIASIKPRYDQPVAGFYRDVTGALITKGQSLDILSSVDDSLNRKIQGLRSWVPDYSKEPHVASFPSTHQASRDSPVRAEWSQGSDVLRLYACVTDEVDLVADIAFLPGTNALDFLMTLYSWFRMAAYSASARPWSWLQDFLGHGMAARRDVETFWRCLILNKAEGQAPAPDAYGGYFAMVMISALLQVEGFPMDEDGMSYATARWAIKRSQQKLENLRCGFAVDGEQLSVIGPRGNYYLFMH